MTTTIQHTGMTEQEINDILEAEQHINTVIVPAYLKLPSVKTVYGEDVDAEIRLGFTPSGMCMISYCEWYMHRDLVAALAPARYGFVDAYTGRTARFVVVSGTHEEVRAMFRKSR